MADPQAPAPLSAEEINDLCRWVVNAMHGDYSRQRKLVTRLLAEREALTVEVERWRGLSDHFNTLQAERDRAEAAETNAATLQARVEVLERVAEAAALIHEDLLQRAEFWRGVERVDKSASGQSGVVQVVDCSDGRWQKFCDALRAAGRLPGEEKRDG